MARSSRSGRPILAAALPVLLALAVYLPVLQAEFVNYDDPVYVTENARVAEGLNPANLRWALTAFVNANWHPLTLVSHMLDVSLFGMRPAGHHATSVVLHALCALALFAVCFAATRRPWPAALTAALFAVHPLNVESVAWIAERKNPLSTLFWLLALLAWVAYRRSPSKARYAAALIAAAAALAAKPMAVTLPFTLVLLDAWLLCDTPGVLAATPRRRALELVPFLLLSLACGLLTLKAQAASSALQTLEAYPLAVRALAVPVSYVWYLIKLVWPSGLAVFYPHPHRTGSALTALGAAGLLLLLTALAYRLRARVPALAGGWAWYLVTLAPVAGVVQVGSQAYADRYAYVPLLGLFAAAVLSAFPAEVPRARGRRAAAIALTAGIVAALSLMTWRQAGYWRDSVTLFRRALAIVPDSSIAWNNLGMAYVARGQVDDGLDCFRRAVDIAPWDTDARSNLGSALTVLGRPAEAVPVLETALERAPKDASVRFNLAKALDGAGRRADAEGRLREATAIDPGYAKAWLYLGILRHRAGRLDEAVPLLERAAALAPADPEVLVALGAAQGARGDAAAALRSFENALRLDPSNARAAEAVRRLRARGVSR